MGRVPVDHVRDRRVPVVGRENQVCRCSVAWIRHINNIVKGTFFARFSV